jgi:[histone H3]-lysine36 N-dimethyltransferase SETMAR
MEANLLHIRHCLLYEFQLEHSAAAAQRSICAALGEHAVSERTCQYWWTRFRGGNFSLEDEHRAGRPLELDLGALSNLLEVSARRTTRELAEQLNTDHATIERGLHSLGKVQKLGAWVPHQLTASIRTQRVNICMSLLSRRYGSGWLSNIVTGDESWVLYINERRKRQWLGPKDQPQPEPKADLHPKKVMLSVWWDHEGIIHWELLSPNTTVTAELYCEQMDRLKEAIERARPKKKNVLLLHDNATPHTAKRTREKLAELNFEILPHPPYSPDLAPSDYHLFRSLHNHLRDKHFDNRDDLIIDLQDFFHSKPATFYARGIEQLWERWQAVVDHGGDYIID